MQATQTTSIGEREYSVTQLPAKRGLRLFNKLLRILAPPAARALGGSGDLSLAALLKADMGGLSVALSLLFEKLTELEQEHILKELFEGARYKDEQSGKSLPLWESFDVVFQGRLHEVYKLASFALEVNFGSFADALKAALSAVPKEAAPASE
jgi:hypothetical protein